MHKNRIRQHLHAFSRHARKSPQSTPTKWTDNRFWHQCKHWTIQQHVRRGIQTNPWTTRLPKRNSKGESLLAVYLGHCFWVMNTFFPRKANGPGHGTWTSNWPTKNGQAELHMLDVIVPSAALHKRLKNRFVAPDGINSDHQAVRMTLNLTSIKYKSNASMHSR